ncbi:MAG TPA: murein L,D-transpeptidase catalytic domain family protein [Chitinophagaceae bacterium]
MKISGLIRTSIVISLVLAVASSRNVSGQLYYASQKSITGKVDREFAVSGNVVDEFKANLTRGARQWTDLRTGPSDHRKISRAETSDRNKDSISGITPSNADEEIKFRATSFVYPSNSRGDVGLADYPSELLILYAEALKDYAKKNGFDTAYALLSNMGMLCNKKRFFVVNLATMEIEQSGLVSHGRGQGPTIYDKQYSNEPGSRCTSLGRYKVLGKYKGNYGEAYRIAGLDSSNSKALDRNIVLHAMNCIPDAENFLPACVSDGCPAVSGKFLTTLSKIIDTRERPVLLWIFDSNLEEPVIDGDYAEPVSIGFSPVVKKSFETSACHNNAQLHSILNKQAHQNKILHWINEQKKKIWKLLEPGTDPQNDQWNELNQLPAEYLLRGFLI